MTHPYTNIINQLLEDIKFSNTHAVNETFAKYCAIDPNFENIFMDEIKGAKKEHFKIALFQIILVHMIEHDIYKERTCNLLSNLCLKNQLYIMENCINSMIINNNIEHFKVALSARDYDANVLLDSKAYHFYIADNFNEEKFSHIDAMEKLLGINCMAHLQKDGYIHYTRFGNVKGMEVPVYLKFNEPVFAPYFDLLINYSEAKEKYILSKNIILPRVRETEEILTTIIQGFDNSVGCSAKDQQILNYALNNYCKVQLYNEMQEALPHHNKTTRSAKI